MAAPHGPGSQPIGSQSLPEAWHRPLKLARYTLLKRKRTSQQTNEGCQHTPLMLRISQRMVGLRVATFCPPSWAKSSSDRAPWRKWALRGTMGCGQMVCVTFSIGAHIPACAHLGERDWVSPINHPPGYIGCPPDQLWQCSGLQPECLVLGAQPTDGRLRGHQCGDTAVCGKSEAGILPGTSRGQ